MKVQQYLICSNDWLQTAFFCGNGKECSEALGVTTEAFYSMVCKGMSFFHFFHVEKVVIEEE